MKSSIWMRCKSWLNCVMCGELRLTADVLWLAEIDGEAPPARVLLKGIGASDTVAGLTRVSQCRSTRLPEIATATPFSAYAVQPFQCDIAY